MARRKRTSARSAQPKFVYPEAAGIDIGARELYVAVHPDRNPRPIRVFRTFTQDLHALARWLERCQVQSVAMESTGVYWIPVYQVLRRPGSSGPGQRPARPFGSGTQVGRGRL